MRRRQIADATSQPTAETGVDAAETVVNPETPFVSETIPADVDTVVASSETAELTPEATETPAPKRRRTPRRKADASEVVDAAALPASEPEAPAAVEQVVDNVESDTPKPRRTPRRRKADAEATPETLTPSEDLVGIGEAASPAPASEPTLLTAETAVEAAEDAQVDAPAETKPRRPRRSRKTAEAADLPAEESVPATPAGEGQPAPLVSIPLETVAAVADAAVGLPVLVPPVDAPKRGRRGTGAKGIVQAPPVPVTEATTSDAAPPRTRGLRRTAPAPTPLLPSPPAYVSPTGEGGTVATDLKADVPVRIRGLRRAPRRALVQTPDAPLTPQLVVPTLPAVPLAYQPLPLEMLQRLPEAKVALRHGMPELTINGTAQLPFWFFVNTEDPDTLDTGISEIRLAYEAGVRFFTVLAHLPWKKANGERRREPLDDALRLVAENAPDAFILPRLIFSPPTSWQRTHEGEMTLYADGETGDVSLASRAFWEEDAPDALRAAVEQMAQSDHAGRIWGVYLEHGEWFYDRGRGLDLSDANTKGFRAWLRTFYKGSLVALRAAWHDGDVTFDNAAVEQPPTDDTPNLFWGPREQQFTDYHCYASDIVAQVINRLGKTVKEASANRLAVAVSYGYTLELSRAGSGHLALGQILGAPHVDILTGPVSYSSRTPGGSAPFPAPVDSVHLAGKLWVSEDDTKTYLAQPDETLDSDNPQIGSLEETRAVYSRNFGAALSRGAGISYMDLWGQGWLADRQIWEHLGQLRKIGDQVAHLRRETAAAAGPDVAVIVDERAFFGVRADEDLLRTLVADTRDTLLRSGARIGWYLMSDLESPNFPASARLLLFLNAFQVSETARVTLRERFQGDGRTLAFVYGPGAREENIAELADALGMQLRVQPWGSKVGTQILSQVRSPLTDGEIGQRLGEEERINPSLYVSDPKAQILGEYVATGNGSIAVRRHTRYQTVFLGERSLTLLLLRGLYRLAGVPIFTVDDDVAWIGDRILCLHSAPGGGTTLYLPDAAGLADLLTGEVLASDGFGARFAMPPQGTRLLLAGSAQEAARFGIDLEAGAPGLAEDERPTLVLPFTPETAAAQPRRTSEPFLPTVSNVSPEDEALFVAALAGEVDLSKKEADTEDEEVAEGTETAEGDNGRKKRRRRRRGRNQADGESETQAEDVTTVDESGEDEVEAFLPLPVDLPRVGTRPSLSELLPLSELPSEGELPPIPDEFLPLETPRAADEAETAQEAETARRPRRGRPRRGRRADETTEVVSEGITADDITTPLNSTDPASTPAAALADAQESDNLTELTSVGVEVSTEEAEPAQAASEIAAVPSETGTDAASVAEDVADAAQALGVNAEEASQFAQSVEVMATDESLLTEIPLAMPETEDALRLPVERPDVSSGEGNPS